MEGRLSGNQVDALGRRLRDSGEIPPDDRRLLFQFLAEHADPLAQVTGALSELDLVSHPRLKSTDTIIEKLRRERISLRGIHDIAGTRVVRRMSLDQQDQLVGRICERCPGSTRLVDRRTVPNHGYRAVHVICRVDGRYVEIQVRTVYQDTWAQLVERMGDWWGRQIRYGSPPTDPDELVAAGTTLTTGEMVAKMATFSELIADAERDENVAGRPANADLRSILYRLRRTLELPDVP